MLVSWFWENVFLDKPSIFAKAKIGFKSNCEGVQFLLTISKVNNKDLLSLVTIVSYHSEFLFHVLKLSTCSFHCMKIKFHVRAKLKKKQQKKQLKVISAPTFV